MKRIAFVTALLTLSPVVWADSLPTGTWVQRSPSPQGRLWMTIEVAGSGRKLTYTIDGNLKGAFLSVFTTQFDGKDAPVFINGQPSGETMAVKLVDDHHTATVIKLNGKQIATSKSELSPDGKVLKVETTADPNGPLPSAVDYWDKK